MSIGPYTHEQNHADGKFGIPLVKSDHIVIEYYQPGHISGAPRLNINSVFHAYLDIHNFHYTSKYKHMVPLICKEGLLDYEVLIRNKFCKKFTEIQKFIAENKVIPIYIIVKKMFKSKKKFFYNFNKNGYSVAIAFHLKELDELKKK